MDKINIKKIEYPSSEFYKFGVSDGALRVPDDVIEDWINQGVDSVKAQLENGEESPFTFYASGDSMVIVFYSQDCKDNMFDDNNYFIVIVARNYEEGDFFISDVKDDISNRITRIEEQIKVLNKQLEEEKKKLKEGE